MSWTEGDGVLRGAREVGPPATHSSWHRSSLGWRARQAGSANPNVHLHPRHKANDVWFGADPAVEAHCQAKALTCDEPWRLIAVRFQLVGVARLLLGRSAREGDLVRTGDDVRRAEEPVPLLADKITSQSRWSRHAASVENQAWNLATYFG